MTQITYSQRSIKGLPTTLASLLETINTNATNAETALATAINTEIAERTSADTQINNLLTVLNGDSNVDGSFRKVIADLIGSAPEALNTLKEIADYITVNPNANVAAAINSAINAAVTSLTASIANEANTRQLNDDTLTSIISSLDSAYKLADVSLSTSIAAEMSARQTAYSSLASTISLLDSAYKSSDVTLSTSILTESTKRQTVDATLATSISNEEASRQAADAALSVLLADEINSRQLEDAKLNNAITVEKMRIDSILLASDADKDSFAEIVTLVNSVDTTNDSTFASYVLSNNDAINILTTEYKSADLTLTATINAEKTARQVSETALNNAISGEAVIRQNADITIATSVSDEVTARQLGDQALTDTISLIPRVAVDSFLLNNVNITVYAQTDFTQFEITGVLTHNIVKPLHYGTARIVSSAGISFDVECTTGDGTYLNIYNTTLTEIGDTSLAKVMIEYLYF